MCILICNTLMSATGASYVAIYHQGTQQISALLENAFNSCHGFRHSEGLKPLLEFSGFSSFSKGPRQTSKIDILAENVNCKHIKISCQSLPHKEFMNLKAFLWFVYKLKFHVIAALAFYINKIYRRSVPFYQLKEGVRL